MSFKYNPFTGSLDIAGSGGSGSSSWGSITGTLSSQTDLQGALDAKVDENTAITGATKTKITYDAKGLVTSGADATKSDIGLGNVDNKSEATIITDVKADTDVASAISLKHAQHSDDQDLSGLVAKSGSIADITTRDHHLLTGLSDDDHSQYLKTDGSRDLTGNQSFAKYKAIAMCCDNGTSFPASPNTGQWFYRSDIKTLFIYEAAWKAIISFGAVTLYVDGTNGSDAVGQGYSSGAGSVKTWTYAFNLIPGLVGGNITINVTGGAYTETATLQGKTFTGPYTITIQGVKSTIESLTVGTGSTKGIYVGNSQMQYATVVRNSGTWTTDQRANKWVRISETGEKRVIDRNTDTTLTIAGSPWTNAPTNGQTMIIEEPLTSITDFRIGTLQQGVIINDIDFTFDSGTNQVLFGATSVSTFNNCRIAYSTGSNIWTGTNNTIIFFQCALIKFRFFIRDGSKAFVSACKLYNMNSATTGRAIQVDSGGLLYIGDGTVIDGLNTAGSIGILCLGEGLVNMNGGLGAATTQRVTVRNCVTGVSGYVNSTVLNTISTYSLYGDDVMPNNQESPTSLTTGKLVDTTVNFNTIGVGVGDKVIILNSYLYAIVTAIDSDTRLSLDSDIFTSTSNFYRILKASSLNTIDLKDEGLFTNNGIKRSPFHIIEGSVTLVAGVATVNLRGIALFSSATNYTVTLSRTIPTAISVVNNSGSQFTITSLVLTDTDVVRFVATGD